MSSQSDRIFAKDADGRVYTVMCIEEFPPMIAATNMLGERRYKTILGDKLISSDGINFTFKSSGKVITKI